jgi:hypothetical protein
MGPASYGQFQHSAPRRRRKQRGEKPISPAGKQTTLFKDGRTLASKFATPQSAVDFCKNSPDADKTDGDCNLDEMRRPGVKEGLQIDVVHQVGPDANNFSSLFSVRVVKRD